MAVPLGAMAIGHNGCSALQRLAACLQHLGQFPAFVEMPLTLQPLSMLHTIFCPSARQAGPTERRRPIPARLRPWTLKTNNASPARTVARHAKTRMAALQKKYTSIVTEKGRLQLPWKGR